MVAPLSQTDSKVEILLVDDDPLVLEIARCNLEICGYSVSTAIDGQVALEQLQKNNFDLLITDLEMPRLDGLALTRAVRSSTDHANLPVLMVTGKDQALSVDEAYSAGATSFLSKPINWELFTRSVKFVLQSAQTEKELRSARDQAASAVKLKQSILSNLTHEMRTPLNHIIGFADLLAIQKQVQEDDKLSPYVENIQKGGQRMLELISDMLFLSVAETDGVKLNSQICSPSTLMQQTYERYESDAAKKEISLQIYNNDQSVDLELDDELLKRALSKLLDNAIKFSPPDTRVQLGFMMNAQTNSPLFFVRDQGQGVPQAQIPYLGEPFQQIDMRLNRQHEGMGIGLRVCKLIADACGAHLKYSNLDEGGFMVALTLPNSCVLIRPQAKAIA